MHVRKQTFLNFIPVDLYNARIHHLSGAQGALLPLLIRLIHHS